MSWQHCKTYLRWPLIVVAYITIPLLLNCILGISNPLDSNVIGTPTDWLGFWAVYLGASIPLIVLWFTIRDNNFQNTKNRNLQTSVLEYQVKMQWINQLTSTLLKCKSILGRDIVNDLYLPFTKCREELLPSIYKEAIEQVDSILFEFKVLFPNEADEVENKFYGVFKEQIFRYKALIDDVLFALRYNSGFKAPNNIPNTQFFEEALTSYRNGCAHGGDDTFRIWEIVKKYDYKLLSNRPQILMDLKNRYCLYAFELQCILFLKHEHEKVKLLISKNGTQQDK